MRIDIYDLQFPNEVRNLLIKQPKLLLIKPDTDIDGLKEYFINLLNSLNKKYHSILSETNSSELQDKIGSLSYDEKVDICIFFKIKSYFIPKLKPTIKSFCEMLNINGSPNLNYLLKNLINTNELSSSKLTYPLKIKCVHCNSSINTHITYLGSSNYTEKQLHCSNCSHQFLLRISNTPREFFKKNFCMLSSVNTTSCDCDSCKNWLNSFTSYISNNIENFRIELFNCIKNKLSNTNTLTLEQLYEINKNSLTKTETELLNLHPKNINEIYLLIDEMNKGSQKKISHDNIINLLLKHGVIYENINESLLKDYIDKYIDKYTYLINLFNSNKIIEIFSGNYNRNLLRITPPYSINYKKFDKTYDYIDFCSIYINLLPEYCINDYYFNDSSTIIVPKRYNIFNSCAETTLFNNLNRQYPNYIICHNAPLKLFVTISELSEHFIPTEIEYLKNYIIDFIIVDTDGYVVKCIELQKSNNHNKINWIYNDTVKRKCFEILGIDFSYEY